MGDIPLDQSELLSNGEDQVEVGLTRNRRNFVVSRPVYTQETFDEGYHRQSRPSKTLKERGRELKESCACSAQCLKSNVYKWFPFLRIMKGYSPRQDLLSDLMSGITVGVMHIPQGMAYGLLANLPPVYGLYVSFFPVIVYFFFGTSRHISIGTFAVVSLMVGSVVDKGLCKHLTSSNTTATTIGPVTTTVPIDNTTSMADMSGVVREMSAEELACKVGMATAVTFLAGLYQLLMGLFHLGFVTIYLSEPLTRAFTTAAAVHVFTSQIKYVFGITVARFTGPLKIVYSYIDFFSKITTTNPAALIMSVISIIIIYLVKTYLNPKVKAKIRIPVPIELIMVVLGTIISYFGNFSERFDMTVVGVIPTGIPAPSFPSPDRFPVVMVDAIGICIVAFAISVSMGQLFAKKHNYDMDSNQELVAYGISNLVSSCFNCYMSAASLSRSLIQEAVGGRTQLAGLVSCSLLLFVLFFIGPLFEQCPNNVLAAIIIVNLKGMFMQLLDLKKLWHISKVDFYIWIVTFLSAVILDIDIGLLCGVCFSLLTVVFRTQRPYTCILGKVPNTDIYKDVKVYGSAKEVANIRVFRFEASMYYANCEHFMNKMFSKVENPRHLKQAREKIEGKKKEARKQHAKKIKEAEEKGEAHNGSVNNIEAGEDFQLPTSDIKCIVVDCSTMAYVDYAAINTLQQVVNEYKEVHIDVVFSGCKAGVREMMEAAGFFKKIDKHSIYLSTHDAVLSAVDKIENTKSVADDEDQLVIEVQATD